VPLAHFRSTPQKQTSTVYELHALDEVFEKGDGKIRLSFRAGVYRPECLSGL
jgi:hypothetical protein